VTKGQIRNASIGIGAILLLTGLFLATIESLLIHADGRPAFSESR
jgi:hypothetical protein